MFLQNGLEDIFADRGIKDETVTIKSDNAPTQYKNNYAFDSIQQFSNNYNITIVRVYDAAGHG